MQGYAHAECKIEQPLSIQKSQLFFRPVISHMKLQLLNNDCKRRASVVFSYSVGSLSALEILLSAQTTINTSNLVLGTHSAAKPMGMKSSARTLSRFRQL